MDNTLPMIDGVGINPDTYVDSATTHRGLTPLGLSRARTFVSSKLREHLKNQREKEAMSAAPSNFPRYTIYVCGPSSEGTLAISAKIDAAFSSQALPVHWTAAPDDRGSPRISSFADVVFQETGLEVEIVEEFYRNVLTYGADGFTAQDLRATFVNMSDRFIEALTDGRTTAQQSEAMRSTIERMIQLSGVTQRHQIPVHSPKTMRERLEECQTHLEAKGMRGFAITFKPNPTDEERDLLRSTVEFLEAYIEGKSAPLNHIDGVELTKTDGPTLE